MKAKLSIMFLMILLASCAPISIAPPTVTKIASTATPTFTNTPVPATPTLELTHSPATPIPIRTPLRFLMTPDAIQVERWGEYQTALIKVVMALDIADAGDSASIYDYALCEWDILGHATQKVYVWAYCNLAGGDSGSVPVVITLDANGSVQKMEAPNRRIEAYWKADVLKMFPEDVRKKFDIYQGFSMFSGRIREMRDHIKSRETSGEPPLVVLSATPAP